jgi:Melibiase
LKRVILALVASLAACDEGASVAGDASVDRAADVPVVPVRPAPKGFRVRVEAAGTLTVEAGGVALAGFDLAVRPVDGAARLLSSLSPSVTGQRVTARTGDGLSVELTVAPIEGSARGAVAVSWRLSGAGRVRGVELRAAPMALPDDARVVTEGSQSWSFAGPFALVPDTALSRDARGEVAWPARLGDPLVDAPGVSFFRGDVAWAAGGLSVCARAPFDRWSAVAFERPGTLWAPRVAVGLLDEEAVSVSDAAPLAGSVVFAPADPSRAFACSDDAPIAARTRPERPFPRAWWSWNTLFERVTAASVTANAAAARALDPRVTHVTLDDGWERAWGDWVAKPAFGATIEDLAVTLSRTNTTLGLWLAPFAVDPTAPLASAHPDWMLRDAAGTPLLAPLVPGRQFLVLDATRPEVQRHLEALFRGLRGAGVTLFKIDFLYAGALPARRFDASATGLQAYRLGLEAIARGAEGAHLNGCGAVVLPALPYVDSMRVGADNTFAVAPPFWGDVAAAARNLGARYELSRWGVQPDPDQPVVRDMPEGEARAFLALGILSGAAFGYGDDLTALTDAQRALYREAWFTRLRDNTRGPAVPLDLVDSAGETFYASPLLESLTRGARTTRALPPSRWRVDLGAMGRAVVLINWFDTERSLGATPAELGADTARELVTEAVPMRSGSRWTVMVPPRTIRVLAP